MKAMMETKSRLTCVCICLCVCICGCDYMTPMCVCTPVYIVQTLSKLPVTWLPKTLDCRTSLKNSNFMFSMCLVFGRL